MAEFGQGRAPVKVIAIVLSVVLTGGAAQRESKASLKETIEWMTNFTALHGIMMRSNSVVQWTRLSGTETCTVQLKRSFPAAKDKQIKIETTNLTLGDLDPNKVNLDVTHSEQGDTFEIDFERSDGAMETESDIENGDGSKTKTWSANFYLFMDSESSAKRVGAALSHAITLCGGKAAPF
jgi:hypothetical protein